MGRIKRYIFGSLAFICFVATAASVETSIIQSVVFLALAVVFTTLGKGFYGQRKAVDCGGTQSAARVESAEALNQPYFKG